uniref:PGG domain-containing protein n=1 Tax=Vitis vinifera TaxID=29760 RepID=A5CAZ0_VITVI|nr:hypothetical protein VITISV_002537 [Vitis vinifera]
MAEYTGSGTTKNDEVRRNLFDCAMQDKWDEAVKVYEQQPWLRPEKITEGGDTLLHIAVRDHQEWVVEKMVKLLRTHFQQSEDVLKSKNKKGNTPLHLAASIGNVSMCQCFTMERNDLVGICNEDGENPLFLAARHGKIKAFICLLPKPWEPDFASSVDIHRRNKKGETIIHCAIAGGHFELAFLIIERYKDVGSSRDEKGVNPLDLLASQPTAFRSGTRLSLFDKIIYHCIFVLPPGFGDAEKSNDPAERQTLVKLLTVPWNNIKGLFFLIVKFIKICINPSGGEKAENARTALDEERPASTPDQGRSYINKIQKKKEKHVWSAKILEKLLDKGKGHRYDSTGKYPVYTDRTILYEGEKSMEAPLSVLPSRTPEKVPEYEESSKERISEKGVGNDMYKQVESSTNLMQKLLEEAQRSTGLIHELLKQAHRLPTMNESNQKWLKSIKEDAEYVPRRTERPRQEEYGPRIDNVQGRIETPILVAAKNGSTEIVEKIVELYPESILDVDVMGKNAVMLAAEYRQTQLYEKLVSRKLLDERAFREVDHEGNSALHLAATLSDYQPYRFAALQMQWEIKWYKYVKNSVPQHLISSRNNANKTPKDVFRESHKDLVEKGGQWLSSTSNSCSVVATLITTVAFASTASVPGGMKENSSRPNLEEHPGFLVFAVSSLIGLCFSVTSVIAFLVILTSRYHQKDFRRDLPTKLLLGLTSLFISLGAMLVCFCAAHYFLLKDKLKLGAFPLYAPACVPVIFFALMQFPFYFDLIRGTFKKVPPRTPSG